jgi:outer membrane protein TolC
MKRSILFIIVALAGYGVGAQSIDTVTLEQCYQQAMQHFPVVKQKELLLQSTDLEIKKLNTQYLPQLALNVQATYQSDVPHIPVESPVFTVPEVPKDQYKGTIDLNQVIYDGGAIKRQKDIKSSALLAQQQNIEVQLYQLKIQVTNLFFNVLLSEAQLEVNDLLSQNIDNQLNKVQAAVDNGVMIASGASVLKAELIKTQQQKNAITQNKIAAVAMLQELTGLAIDTASAFKYPQTTFSASNEFSARPEYKLYQLQQQTLDLQQKGILSRQLPRLGAFAQGGFGRPGFNLLNPELKPIYIAGLKLSWSPWHWNEDKYDRQIITINKSVIDNQREVFDINNRIALLKQSATIQSLQQQIALDDDVIALREEITRSASAQLENGVITSTDYLIELLAEQQARLSMKTHAIQLEQAKSEYLLTVGK